jgi:predicted RNase H-like nuclease (RuvC/YqgF family)
MASEPIPFVGYIELEEESLTETLRHQLRIQQHEIDRLNAELMRQNGMIDELKNVINSKIEREKDVAVWYLERSL